jgi:hypothetical protein
MLILHRFCRADQEGCAIAPKPTLKESGNSSEGVRDSAQRPMTGGFDRGSAFTRAMGKRLRSYFKTLRKVIMKQAI